MGLTVALVAGEASGDRLGAGLVRELKALAPDVTCEGVAGPLMRAAGCEVLADSHELAVMGLVEPLRELPRLIALRRRLVRRWQGTRPDVFVGIDSPDFNLGLEIALKRASIRTVQYVSPQVWAWRQGRLAKIARAADKVLCLLPFEKAFYDAHGQAAEFVGHPLADTLVHGLPPLPARDTLGIAEDAQVLAVLPGSRRGEVARLGPVFAAACRQLAEARPGLVCVAPMATPEIAALFRPMLAQAGVADVFRLLDGNAHTAIAASDVVLLASGTAALEAALIGRPMVAAYRLAAATYALAKGLNLVKVRHFTLPNLLTDEPMVPEFLQGEANPAALAGAVDALFADPGRRAAVRREFATLRDRLARGADRLAARAVLELVT
ncbi:MAG TPA: lipid-A-disaccharide synthase [Woeseiaceae bacterium]